MRFEREEEEEGGGGETTVEKKAKKKRKNPKILGKGAEKERRHFLVTLTLLRTRLICCHKRVPKANSTNIIYVKAHVSVNDDLLRAVCNGHEEETS